MDQSSLFQTITFISAIIMVILILLQHRGASLGAGFGGSGELYTTRRGLDKSMFHVTIVFAIIFVSSILAPLLIPA
jgi:preprotein translocase subunit SecG